MTEAVKMQILRVTAATAGVSLCLLRSMSLVSIDVSQVRSHYAAAGRSSLFCNGSLEHSQGSWSSNRSDSLRQPTTLYPLYDLWSACGDERRRFTQYVRKNDCFIPDLMTAVRWLGNRTLYFAGDSLTGELYYSIRWLRRRAILYNSLWVQPSLKTAVTALSCSQGWEGAYETNSELLDAMRKFLGWERRRQSSRETCGTSLLENLCTHCGWPTLSEALAVPPSPRNDDVLVLNIGRWYEWRSIASWEQFEQMMSFLNALEFPAGLRGMQLVGWTRQQLNLANFSAVDKCGGQRRLGRQQPRMKCTKLNLEPVDYAHGLLLLAEVILEYADRLPEDIFWVDTLPEHFKATGKIIPGCFPHSQADSPWRKTWRNQIAHRLLPALLPSVTFIDSTEILADWWKSHWSDGDCVHYCQGTQGWNEHVANVLTAIVKKGSVRTHPILPDAFPAADDPRMVLVAALDRFSSSGRMSLYTAISLCSISLLALLILFLWLCTRLVRWICCKPLAPLPT